MTTPITDPNSPSLFCYGVANSTGDVSAYRLAIDCGDEHSLSSTISNNLISGCGFEKIATEFCRNLAKLIQLCDQAEALSAREDIIEKQCTVYGTSGSYTSCAEGEIKQSDCKDLSANSKDAIYFLSFLGGCFICVTLCMCLHQLRKQNSQPTKVSLNDEAHSKEETLLEQPHQEAVGLNMR